MSKINNDIVLFGSVESSLSAIKSICKSKYGNLKCLVTTRNKNNNSDYVDLTLHVEDDVQVIFIEDFSINEICSVIELNKIKIGFCVGWSYLIPKQIHSQLDLFLAYHPSPLPVGRGRNPITWAIALGMKQTASSFFLISDKPDAGDIVSQKKIVIASNDTARSLYDKIIEKIDEQVEEILRSISNKNLFFNKQDTKLTSYWRKRNDADRLIDFRMSSESILNLVRSLGPPYVYPQISFNGIKYNVKKASTIDFVKSDFIEFGKILAVKKNTITVKTCDGAVVIELLDSFEGISEGDYL